MPDNTTTTTQNTTTTEPNTSTQTDEKQKEIDRLLTENQNIRKISKDNEAALNLVKEEIANLKKAGHKSSGDWQKVAEAFEAEAKTSKDKYEKATKAFVNTLTGAKIKEEALKNGFKADLVDLLDTMEFDEVDAFIDENERFNVKGYDVAISNLKKLRPSLFDSANPPQFNNGQPNNGKPSPPKNLEDAKLAFIAATKTRTKDPAAYNKANMEYQKAIIEDRKSKK